MVNKMSDKKTIDTVIQKLEDKKNPQKERVDAIQVLSHIIDEKAIASLIKTLGDKDKDIVREAKKALRTMKTHSIKPLSSALYSGNWRIRNEAAQLLSNKDFGISGKLAIIAHDLASKNFQKQISASGALNCLDAEAIEPLVETWKEMANGPTPEIRISSEQIIDALGNIGPAAINGLIKIIQIGDWPARKRAIQALGRIGDNRAIDTLLHALKDKNGYVRREAVNALGSFGNTQTVDALINALEENPSEFLKETQNWIRQEIIEALGKIKGTKAISFIITELANSDHYINDTAAKTLKNLGPEAMPQLILALGNLNKDIRIKAGEILLSKPELSLDPLLQALEIENPKIRAEAIWLLGEIGYIKAKEALFRLSKHSDKEIRVNVNAALSKIDHRNSAEKQ